MGLSDRWFERWASTASGPTSQHVPPGTPRALTAAGTKVNLRKPDPAHTRHEQWQYEAWRLRNEVPEARFASDFVGDTLGRLRVFAAENRPRGEEPVPLESATRKQQASNGTGVDQYTIECAEAAVERLGINQHGSNLLTRFGQNLDLAGQCYLLGELDDDGREQWTVRSILECQITTGGGRLVDPEGGAEQRTLKDDEVDLFTVWNPDPAFYNRADAPVRGVLSALRAMDMVNQRGLAHDQSRISAGKALFLPQELMMVSGPAALASDIPGVIDDPASTDFLLKFIEYMTTAINNTDDPSSVVPLLLTGPATIDQVPTKELIGTFDLHGEDPKNLDARYEALTIRYARGMSLSPERIKGIAESSSTWTANVVTADEIKMAIEPRAERLCDSITAAYLSWTLRRMGVPADQRAKICLWYSAAELVQNPNRGQDAKALFDAGELSGAALRDANGFPETTAPSTQERLLRALTQGELANASVPALLKLAAGQLPTVADLTALEQVQAQIAERANRTRPVVDATPNRSSLLANSQDASGVVRNRTGEHAGPPPPVGERTQPATASQPGALGASAGKPAEPQWRLDRRATRKLVDIDRALVDVLLTLAESHVGRATEKASNRIRSDATKTSRAGKPLDALAAAAFPKGTDAREAVAAAGEPIARVTDVAQLDALIDGAIDDLEPRFRAEIEKAAQSADAVLDRMLARGVVAAGASSWLTRQIGQNAGDAWRWLSQRLRAHARRVLYGRHVPSRNGVADPGIVPASLVKGAVAIAGGLPRRASGLHDDGTSLAGPLSGVATGEVALDRLRVSGAVVIAKEWVYPPVPRATFKPHLALDGVVFEEWTDAALKVGADDAWVAGGYYHPGDHQSCLCLVEPIAVVPMTEAADNNGAEIKALRTEALGR